MSLGQRERNRCGILLATESTAKTTKTLSHVLWALYNLLPAHSFQKPHKHSALALDLAVYAPAGTYTMMGPDIQQQGRDHRLLSVLTGPLVACSQHHQVSLCNLSVTLA